MAKKSATRRRTADTKKKATGRSWLSILRRWLLQLLLKTVLWSGLLAILVGTGYLYYLDRSISKTFEGRRWSVPAQIYAQPVELYAGKRLTNAELQVELQRLGYRKTSDLSQPGSYQPIAGGVSLHLRAFAFMSEILVICRPDGSTRRFDS